MYIGPNSFNHFLQDTVLLSYRTVMNFVHISNPKISIDVGKIGGKIIIHILSHSNRILSLPVKKSDRSRWCVS